MVDAENLDAAHDQCLLEVTPRDDRTPKTRLAPTEKKPESEWNFRGFVQQFYQDDQIDIPDQDSDTINQALISDVDLYLQRRSDTDTLIFDLDAGLVNDFLENDDKTRVSSASIEYARDSFRLIGGRQSRTMTGVYGRFDGIVYKDISSHDYRFSYAYGYLVESSFDSVETDRPFLGINMNFRPGVYFDADLYLINQEFFGLTDRQAVGTEIRYQKDNNFAFVADIEHRSQRQVVSEFQPGAGLFADPVDD